MILRKPVRGRGGRRSHDNPEGRMEYWRQGNFTAIVGMWKKALLKSRKGRGRISDPKSDEEKQLERQEKAVEFLERKMLAKACGRALSEGVGNLDHPEQRAQQRELERHSHDPSPCRAT